jgi:AbrB family looped-hinge helix DNA binding protein
MRRIKPTRRRGFTRLSAKRQVTLPLALVRSLNLAPGDELRVEADDSGRIILSPEPSVASRRREALREVAGSMPGVWEPGALDTLRDEWR